MAEAHVPNAFSYDKTLIAMILSIEIELSIPYNRSIKSKLCFGDRVTVLNDF
jgi:hypothetical protein